MHSAALCFSPNDYVQWQDNSETGKKSLKGRIEDAHGDKQHRGQCWQRLRRRQHRARPHWLQTHPGKSKAKVQTKTAGLWAKTNTRRAEAQGQKAKNAGENRGMAGGKAAKNLKLMAAGAGKCFCSISLAVATVCRTRRHTYRIAWQIH